MWIRRVTLRPSTCACSAASLSGCLSACSMPCCTVSCQLPGGYKATRNTSHTVWLEKARGQDWDWPGLSWLNIYCSKEDLFFSLPQIISIQYCLSILFLAEWKSLHHTLYSLAFKSRIMTFISWHFTDLMVSGETLNLKMDKKSNWTIKRATQYAREKTFSACSRSGFHRSVTGATLSTNNYGPSWLNIRPDGTKGIIFS